VSTNHSTGLAPQSVWATVAETIVGPAGRRAQARALVLLAAFASFVLSVSLWFAGNTDEGLFVGIWVPSIISFGTFVFPREESK
jgi:hypothetical protein